jgi:hypothetical protein
MKLPKLKVGDPVCVYWLDAAAHGAQWSEGFDGEPEEAHCFTLGYYLAKTRKFLVVAQTWERDGVHSKFEIPIGCIEEVTVLSIPTKRNADKP